MYKNKAITIGYQSIRGIFALRYAPQIKSITCYRYFRDGDNILGGNTSNKKTTEFTKSVKSKYRKHTHEQEKALYSYETREKIQNPSGYQHVKRLLRQCKNTNEVMKLMSDCKKCEDVQVGTLAMKQIKIFHEKGEISASKTISNVEIIWDMMEEYVVGMDCAAYNEYFHVRDLTKFNNKMNNCRVKFDQMIARNIMPDKITLNILLKTCRKSGDTKTAYHYWETIVIDQEQHANAEGWASFLAVCAKAEDIRLAEECFNECPYKNNLGVCYRMMSAYKNIGNIDKVLEIKKYMEEDNIEMDIRVYNTIAAALRKEQQWQQAIDIMKEALSKPKSKEHERSITHLLLSTIGLLKITDDFRERERILRYIEFDITNYLKEIDEQRLRSTEHGNRMLDAYVSTYRDAFGPTMFEEICSKYTIEYWEVVEQQEIPTLNLFFHNYSVAKVILEYVFEKEIDTFRDCGLNILISDDKRQIFDVVTKQDVNLILASFPTVMSAIEKQPHLLYISSEQTKNHDGGDEPLF